MKNERVYKLIFASVYPHYLKKTETKGHTKAELDTIICWLTGYTQKQLQQQIDKKIDLETFFAQAPQINPNVSKITGGHLRISCRRDRRQTHAKDPLYG